MNCDCSVNQIPIIFFADCSTVVLLSDWFSLGLNSPVYSLPSFILFFKVVGLN